LAKITFEIPAEKQARLALCIAVSTAVHCMKQMKLSREIEEMYYLDMSSTSFNAGVYCGLIVGVILTLLAVIGYVYLQ
jgi:hypothetical protein